MIQMDRYEMFNCAAPPPNLLVEVPSRIVIQNDINILRNGMFDFLAGVWALVWFFGHAFVYTILQIILYFVNPSHLSLTPRSPLLWDGAFFQNLHYLLIGCGFTCIFDCGMPWNPSRSFFPWKFSRVLWAHHFCWAIGDKHLHLGYSKWCMIL